MGATIETLLKATTRTTRFEREHIQQRASALEAVVAELESDVVFDEDSTALLMGLRRVDTLLERASTVSHSLAELILTTVENYLDDFPSIYPNSLNDA